MRQQKSKAYHDTQLVIRNTKNRISSKTINGYVNLKEPITIPIMIAKIVMPNKFIWAIILFVFLSASIV